MRNRNPSPTSATPMTSGAVKTIDTRSILGSVADGEELSPAGALHLLSLTKEDDLHRLRETADEVRKRQVGEAVTYHTGCSLYLTNRCEMSPRLYPYPRQPGEPGAYTLTIDDIDACLEQAAARQTERIYISGGGFWPLLEIPGLEAANLLKTYARFTRYIREKAPDIQIAGFSPDEVEFLGIVAERNERYVLELLKDQGLQRLGGQGSEILQDKVRQKISPKKASVARWLDITAMACTLEIPVSARMESGPVETLQQRVSHLETLRRFQQEHPGAFTELVPQMWARIPAEAGLPIPGMPFCKPIDRLKLSAVVRLFLGESLPDQTVCWQPKGETEAQEALQWGANAFGATDPLAYHAFLSASRQAKQYTAEQYTMDDFERLITETGRSPQSGALISG